MSTRGTTTARVVATARCAWGAACLAAPARVLTAASGVPDAPALGFTRLLGARELAQGLVTLAAPHRAVLAGGAVVDALHAGSVLGLAAADRSRRRPALVNAAAATGWAVLGLSLCRDRGLRRPPPRAA